MNTNQISVLDFSGAAIMGNTKEGNIRRTKSGNHKLSAVTVATSKSNHPTVKFVFDSMSTPNAGHDEYLRTSSADKLVKSIMKLRYLIANGGNQEAKDMFATLPNPIEAFQLNGAVVTFEKNEELDALRAENGEAIDWVWAGKDSKTRIAVTVKNAREYCEAFANVCQKLVGTTYSLRISQPKEGDRFQNLDSIEAVLGKK